MDQVKKYITRATELTAISVTRLIKQKGFTPQDILDEQENIKRERLIDQAGVDAMATALTDIPFVLEIVGSEGRKHVHQYGEALPVLMGTFGPAPGGAGLKLDMVNDVVEGSKSAKLNLPGAVSVIAVGSHKSLLATPDDIDYMDKLFGPPQLKGKISMEKSVEENLAETVDTFGVTPEKINVVILDRERNAHYINACKKFGVNLVLIKLGDFMPSILAFSDPKKERKGLHLLMGSGGFEEGIMAAVAGKALGGFVEARGWSGDPETQNKYLKVWTNNDLVSGKKEECFVSISAITGDNEWFDLPAFSTLTVSSLGVKISATVHH